MPSPSAPGGERDAAAEAEGTTTLRALLLESFFAMVPNPARTVPRVVGQYSPA